jgi:hypothetical protein
MILTAGKTNVEKLIAGDAAGKRVYKIGVGTSNTPVSPGDTALTGAVIKDVDTYSLLSGNILQLTATLAAGDPAMTIREVGLYNEDDVLVHRKVIPDKTKTAGVSYVINYKIPVQ